MTIFLIFLLTFIVVILLIYYNELFADDKIKISLVLIIFKSFYF